MPARLLASVLLASVLLAAAVLPQRAAAAPPRSAALGVSAVVVRPVVVDLVPARAPFVFVDGAPPGSVLEVRAAAPARGVPRAGPVVGPAREEQPRFPASDPARRGRTGA